jgi:hypothetical protein
VQVSIQIAAVTSPLNVGGIASATGSHLCLFGFRASSVQRHLVVDPLLGVGRARKINWLHAFFQRISHLPVSGLFLMV